MGEGTAQTLSEIEETRGRLEEEIGELESRLPPAARWSKRLVGVAVGGGVGAGVLWIVLRRVRRKRRAAQGTSGQRFVLEVKPDG